jgi:hypothetical protein
METPLESHGFITLLTTPWFLAVVGGTIVLGIAIAYGIISSRQRTDQERAETDAASRKVYHKTDDEEEI